MITINELILVVIVVLLLLFFIFSAFIALKLNVFYYWKYPKVINLEELEIIKRQDLVKVYISSNEGFVISREYYTKALESQSDFIQVDEFSLVRKDSLIMFKFFGRGTVKYKGFTLHFLTDEGGNFISIYKGNNDPFIRDLKYEIKDGKAIKVNCKV